MARINANTYTSAEFLRDEIRRSISKGGHVYVTAIIKVGQTWEPASTRVFDARVRQEKLQVRIIAGPSVRWSTVAVRQTIITDKATSREHSYLVGAL
jgi:hypothetical protein